MEEVVHEKYLINSAGRKMIINVPLARKEDSVEFVLDFLKKDLKSFKTIDYVYVIEEDETLVGVVSIKGILGASKSSKLEEIMRTSMITVSPDADQEKVADLAVKHNIKVVPVVKNKKLVGVVPTDKILSILNRALREDVLHLAGIHKAHLQYENTLAVPLFKSILHRLPWLLIGLFGITIAAIFISVFESTLQKYLILAFFVPAIVYMSDALGTQHQTLFIRDLAIMGQDLNIKKYFLKQMVIGALLGLIIGFVIFVIISLFWKETFIAFVIGISMFITLTISSFTALTTTLIIKKLKMDPALGSGPFATIVSDVSSILVYFIVAILLLHA